MIILFRFFDPMIDHAAMVELQLLDRLVFACDESVPAVIYKVGTSQSYLERKRKWSQASEIARASFS